MNELDQLLQDALDDAADRVPVSHDAWIRNEELLHAHKRPHHTRMAVVLSAAAASVVAVLVAVTVWLIPGHDAATPATSLSDTPTPAASATPRPTPHPSAAPSATETTPSASTSDTGSSPVSTGPINEEADDTLRSQLTEAFIAWHDRPTAIQIPASAIADIRKGALYYAYEPSTDTYWAQATFELTPAAARTNVAIEFQDFGDTASFSRTGSGAWTVHSIGVCHPTVPADIAQLWSLPSHTDDPVCK